MKGKEKELVYRNGAGIHDLICVSGDLGGAYMGLQLLERERMLFEKDRDIQPVLEGYDYVLERQLKPEARRDITAIVQGTGNKAHIHDRYIRWTCHRN